MSQLGRISGPLLTQNLLRNGTDLAFETSLLYLNVGSKYLGINTNGPSSDLTIGTVKNDGTLTNSKIGTVNLRVDTTASIGNFTIGTSTIQHLTNSININPASSGTTVTPGLSTSNLYLYSNAFSNTVTNDSINISPNGTGQTTFSNIAGSVDVTVNAGLHATGDITWDGNITLGNAATDTITFAAEVNSDILPQVLVSLITPVSQQVLSEAVDTLITEDSQNLFTDPAAPYYATTYLYDLGSTSLQWANIYSNTITTVDNSAIGTITATTSNIGNFVLSSNNISNSVADSDFTLFGTGQVKFNNWPYIQGNKIVNPTQLAFNLASTSNGYVKINSKTAFVLPVGTTSTGATRRPINPESGTTRWNTDLQYIEIFNGTDWIPVYGNATNATVTNAEDFSTLYTIVFGY